MASAAQIAALNVVHKHCEDSEMTRLKQQMNEVMLKMERNSMAAEDVRSAMMSPYGCRHRHITWKEFALECKAVIHHLEDDVIGPTRVLVQQARQKALQVVLKPDAPTQKDVFNLLVDAEKCLNESDSESVDED